MKYMSKEKYNEEMRRIQRINISRRRRKALRDAKEYVPRLSLPKLPSTSKLVLWTVVFLCIQLIFFVEKYVMLTGDATALIALVGIMPTLISVVAGYFNKSTKENTVGGIIYETAMREKIEYAERSDGALG